MSDRATYKIGEGWTWATYTQDQYDRERASFERSRRQELRNIERALTSFRWENTSDQEARLAAVKDLLIHKRRG